MNEIKWCKLEQLLTKIGIIWKEDTEYTTERENQEEDGQSGKKESKRDRLKESGREFIRNLKLEE